MAELNDPDFEKVWQDLAEDLNHLPIVTRQRYRQDLGQFMHDMKHTLGLVINANEIILRDMGDDPENERSKEMLDIVRSASKQLNVYFDVIVNGCLNRLDVGE